MIVNAQDIRDAGNKEIVQIIQSEVELQKRGANFVGCCPFHKEKTPSFTVFPSTGTYKCFGCGEGGDAVSFLIDLHGFTFPEALEKVAAIVRKTIDYDTSGGNIDERRETLKKQKAQKDAQIVQLELVLQTWQREGLPFGEIITEKSPATGKPETFIEIGKRKFPVSIFKEWGLTYAPKTNIICKEINRHKWPKSLLLEVGIINQDENRFYDFFRDRFIFPIHNHRNQLVGFGGRIMPDGKHPAKYINSKQSLAFDKSELLYGLHKARRFIVEKDEAILVEGYTDVLSMHYFGFGNTVAGMGTSWTEAQARLLKRSTKQILFLKDGDTAGIKSMKQDVVAALKAGIMPSVCILPDKSDPDSYLWKNGAKALKKYIKKHRQDGLVWRVMEDYDKDNIHKQIIAINFAADLLLHLDTDMAREAYIKKLTATNKLGRVTKELRKAIEDKESVAIRQGKGGLTADQSKDVQRYGLFERHRAYWSCTDPDGISAIKISNFLIEPIMLIVARKESRRLVKIVNQYKAAFIADIDSKIFSSFQGFSQYIEGQGNFMFLETAKSAHFIKIKRKIYAKMPTCYPIYTMGWHKTGGFWTWSNGLSTINGQFIPVNDYGLVDFKGTKYFLKSHSQIENDVKSDDDENTNEDQKKFQYFPDVRCISVEEWGSRFVQVHRKNGMVALAWFTAAIFRDIIYPKVNCFPHLFLFGPPRAGKSYTAWSLQYMFGASPKGPTHMVQATDAAFFRAFSWIRNAVTWIDEYGNEASYERVESLKMAYDGTGREKAMGGYGNDVTRTPINNAVCISGQQQPTQDIALMTRCICLSYPKREFSTEEEENATNLREIEQSGMLTQITAQLLKYRELIDQHFQEVVDRIKSILRDCLQRDGLKVDSRLLLNYSIMLGVYEILISKTPLRFGFEVTDLQEYALENLKTQMDNIDNQDETAIFWGIIASLVRKRNLAHGEDVIVEPKSSEKFRPENNRSIRSDTEEIKWEEKKVLLYINMTRAHGEYVETHRRTRNKPGLDKKALEYYLKGGDAYIGEKRAKRFNERPRSCFVFDRDLIPAEFLLTAVEKGEVEDDDDSKTT